MRRVLVLLMLAVMVGAHIPAGAAKTGCRPIPRS